MSTFTAIPYRSVVMCVLTDMHLRCLQAFKGGVWSFEPRSADAVEMAEAAAEAEAAAAAARAAFLDEFAAARAAASKARPASVSAALAAWRRGPHWDRVAALLVSGQHGSSGLCHSSNMHSSRPWERTSYDHQQCGMSGPASSSNWCLCHFLKIPSAEVVFATACF